MCLGGAQSLHTNAMDEALGIPSEKAAKVALRTQQIIAHETNIPDTIDPLGGSYYLEYLTKQIEEKTMDYLAKIEEIGGVLPGIEKEFFQRETIEVDQNRLRNIKNGDLTVVGVNKFISEEDIDIEVLKVEPELEMKQKERVQKLRKDRNNDVVKKSLEKLRQATKDGDRLMPHVIDAVKSYATIEEICNVWREEFGVYKPQVIL